MAVKVFWGYVPWLHKTMFKHLIRKGWLTIRKQIFNSSVCENADRIFYYIYFHYRCVLWIYILQHTSYYIVKALFTTVQLLHTNLIYLNIICICTHIFMLFLNVKKKKVVWIEKHLFLWLSLIIISVYLVIK